MNIELHYVGTDGTDRILPDVSDVSVSPVFGDYGSFSFSYPSTGKNFGLLKDKDEFELQVYIDGVKRPKLGGLIKDIDGDDVEEASVWKFTGLMYLCILDEAITFPANWPSYSPTAPSRTFVNITAGNLMRTMLAEAQTRGALVGVTFNSFSATVDSNGQPWQKQINIEVKPGVKLSNLAKNLLGLGMAEFEMVGRDFRMYNPGTLSVDRTLQNPPLTFRKGRDLRDSPRKRSSREVATVMLAAGKEDAGVYHAEVDAGQVAARRRIEGYISNGNITDPGTLEGYAELRLQQTVQARMEKTHGLEFGEAKSPRPIDNFDVGDWVYSDTGNGLEKLRAKQWVLQKGADGVVAGSVVLNDLFAEASERLSQRMDGISGGSTITGESKATDVPDAVIDSIAPKTPTGLGLSSTAYTDNQGTTFAAIQASWVQVTQNSDDTILEDLSGHQLEWRTPLVTGMPGVRVVNVGEATTAQWSPVVPNTTVEVRIRAFDKANNYSPFSAWVEVTSASDTTPPAAPAAPVVENMMGMLRISWNGLLASSSAPPPDFRHVEVHVSDINNFTPSATTLVGVLTTKDVFYFRAPYGATRYAKLVPVDRSGNVGAASAQGSGASTAIVGADILDGAVGSLKLADLAVTNAKLGDLAVNTAKVSELSVARLSTGIMTAEVTIGGRFATALSGARTEFNSLGFFRYDAAGNVLVAIDASGALITGQYRTGLAGTRRITMGLTGQTTGRIDFYSPGNDNAFVQAYTESTGTEAIQVGVARVGSTFNSLWNVLNINSSAAGEYTTLRSGTLEFAFDSGDVQKGFDGVTPGAGRFALYQATNRGDARGIIRVEINKARMTFWDQWVAPQLDMIREYTHLWGWPQFGGLPTPRLSLRREDGYMIHGTNIDGVFHEFNINGNTIFNFRPNKGSHQWTEAFQVESSPHQRIMTGSNFGGLIKTWNDSRGIAFEFLQWNDSSFIPLRASNFEVNSDMRDKEDIRESDVDSYLDRMTAKPQKFRRKGEFTQDAELVRTGKNGKPLKKDVHAPIQRVEELGLMVQDLPEDLRMGTEEDHLTYGQAQMNAWLWGAIAELRDEVRAGK